ncbi:MAG: hypothetical protein GY934_07220, partial [Gammaproteobacteria bacterium]|nr:hypothetical protein [Gammaproteobacteria bacterium]
MTDEMMVDAPEESPEAADPDVVELDGKSVTTEELKKDYLDLKNTNKKLHK